MSLLSLPNELLLEIVERLDKQSDINAFVRLHSRTYHLAIDYLYRFHVKHHGGRSIKQVIRGGLMDSVKRFICAGVEPSSRHLDDAITRGHVEILKVLVDRVPDTFERLIGHFVHTAVSRRKSRNGDCLQWMIERGNLKDHEILWRIRNFVLDAVDNRNEGAVRVLLEYGVSQREEPDTFTPLHRAAKKGLPRIAQVLLDHGADINIVGPPPERQRLIHSAVSGGSLAIVRMIVERDPQAIHYRDRKGKTPLHYAALSHEYRRGEGNRTVQYLAELGANLDALTPGARGYSPLHLAAQNGNERMVLALLAAGADPNLRSLDAGRTAVHFTLRDNRGHVAALELLMKHGANPHAQDAKGNTVLHRALMWTSQKPHIDALLQRWDIGISLGTRNKKRQTPYNIALKRAPAIVRHALIHRIDELERQELEGGAQQPDAPSPEQPDSPDPEEMETESSDEWVSDGSG